jgi:3-oxoacyl-[acyl-carrier protein] reductase
LVNNAGVNVAKGTPFYALTLSQWQQTIDVNLTGTFLCSWEVSKSMIDRRQGNIINITSVHGLATASGNAAYAASKAGIIQLTKAMAVDLAPYGIHVNAIAPGAIALEHQPEDPEDVINDYILLRRWGTVDEIASLALFLASDEASYINGETITADGGLLTLLPGKPMGTP